MKASASQNSCEAKVSLSSGGKVRWVPPGTSVCVLVVAAIGCSRIDAAAVIAARSSPHAALEDEQQEHGNREREDTERLGHGKAEEEVCELALRGRRVAQRRREV